MFIGEGDEGQSIEIVGSCVAPQLLADLLLALPQRLAGLLPRLPVANIGVRSGPLVQFQKPPTELADRRDDSPGDLGLVCPPAPSVQALVQRYQRPIVGVARVALHSLPPAVEDVEAGRRRDHGRMLRK